MTNFETFKKQFNKTHDHVILQRFMASNVFLMSLQRRNALFECYAVGNKKLLCSSPKFNDHTKAH